MADIMQVALDDRARGLYKTFSIEDDFIFDLNFGAALLWSDVQGGTPAEPSVQAEGTGGILSIPTSAVDNEDNYVYTTIEFFKFAAAKPLTLVCRCGLAEANTDDANIVIGLNESTPAADFLQDNGAGVPVDKAGAWFEKRDGETKWRVASSDGTTLTNKLTDVTNNVAATAYQTLVIKCTPKASDIVEVTFGIDANGGNAPIQCREDGINPRAPAIKQEVDISGASGMSVVMGAKSGGANLETLRVDYIACYQKR